MTNPADHVLDVITNQPNTDNTASNDAEEKLISMQDHALVDLQQADQNQVANKRVHNVQRSSWWHQFKVLLQRSFTEQLRSRDVMVTLIIQNILMAIFIGTAFLQIGNTQESMTRRLPVLFFCVINQGTLPITVTCAYTRFLWCLGGDQFVPQGTRVGVA
jgi:ATP-binding cassette subfamily G (WHITE) protein 2